MVTASLSRAAENNDHTTLHILKTDSIRFSELKKPSAKIATPQDYVEHGYLGHYRLEQADGHAILYSRCSASRRSLSPFAHRKCLDHFLRSLAPNPRSSFMAESTSVWHGCISCPSVISIHAIDDLKQSES